MCFTKQEQLKDQSRSYKNQKMFSFTILVCLNTSLLNVGHWELQLRSSISHNSIHFSFEVFQSLLQSHTTLGINCRSAQFTYGHVTVDSTRCQQLEDFYAPAIYNGGGGGAYSITLVCTSVRTYICTYVPYVRKMVSGRYLLKTLVYWIHISYTGI